MSRFSAAVSAELADDAVPATQRRRAPLRDAATVERDEASWRRGSDSDDHGRGRGRRSRGRVSTIEDERGVTEQRGREHVSAYLDESTVVGVTRRSERRGGFGQTDDHVRHDDRGRLRDEQRWDSTGPDDDDGRLRSRDRGRADDDRTRDKQPRRKSRFKLIMGRARSQYDDSYEDEYGSYDDYDDEPDGAYEDEAPDGGYDGYDELDDYDDYEDLDDYDEDDEPYEPEIDLTIHHRRRRNRFDDAPPKEPDRNPYIYDYNGRQRGMADPRGKRSRARRSNGGIRAVPRAIGSAVVGAASHIHKGGVMFVLVVALTIAVLFAPLRDLYIANRRLDTLQETYDALLAENDSIRAQLESLQTREGIENEARARGYVEPGETKVVVNGLPQSEEEDAAAAAVHDIELLDNRPWYVRTLDSIFGYEPEA